jgi:hypothetical protein
MPSLFEDLLLSWEAFWTLTNSRQIGFGGLGPIPFSEIAEYIRFRGIRNVDLQEAMIYNIRYLDNEFLKLKEEKEEKDGDRHGDDGSERNAGSDRPVRRSPGR